MERSTRRCSGRRDGDEELSGITQVPLFDEPRVAVVAAAHRLAGKATCRFADLENEVWVRHTSGVSPVWRAFWRLDDLRAGRPARLAPQAIDSVEEVLQQVGAGTAVALTHASAGRFYRRPTVAFVPVEGIQPSTLSVAWADHDGPFIAEFVAAATDATRSLRPPDAGTSLRSEGWNCGTWTFLWRWRPSFISPAPPRS